jgi:hypothetical protein
VLHKRWILMSCFFYRKLRNKTEGSKWVAGTQFHRWWLITDNKQSTKTISIDTRRCVVLVGTSLCLPERHWIEPFKEMGDPLRGASSRNMAVNNCCFL